MVGRRAPGVPASKALGGSDASLGSIEHAHFRIGIPVMASDSGEARLAQRVGLLRARAQTLEFAWKLDPHCTGALGCTGPHCIAAVLACNLSYQGKTKSGTRDGRSIGSAIEG